MNNQTNTQKQTTAIHTTNFRDCKELYHFDIFPDDYSFYSDDILIKRDFEDKFFNYYYMSDLAWDQISIWKHYFKNHMMIENVKYKQMYDLKVDELDLSNVDIKELTSSINEGEGESESESDSVSTGSSKNDGTVHDYDTPQGNINLNNIAGYVSGISETANTGSSSNTGSALGKSKNKAKNEEDTTRSLKGYQGQKTVSELKKELLNVIINIDKQIIEDCEKLFLNVW